MAKRPPHPGLGLGYNELHASIPHLSCGHLCTLETAAWWEGGCRGVGVSLFFTKQMGHTANGKERHPGLGGRKQV